MLPSSQSAYCQFHSTETAVLKVHNDLLLAADSGQVSALCLLDLTLAFNTVDHDLLMLRLERQFCLHSVVLQCFSSYLTGPLELFLAATVHLWFTCFALCTARFCSTLCPKKRPPFYFSNNSLKNLPIFDDFWCVKS